MRRGRLMLSALLAMVLPTAALANSKSLSFTTGTGSNFESGTWCCDVAFGQVTLSVTGKTPFDNISMSTGLYFVDPNCPGGAACFEWNGGGSVSVENATGTTIFTDSLSSGELIDFGGNNGERFTINASLLPNSILKEGTLTFGVTVLGLPDRAQVLGGNAEVIGSVPEPSAVEGLLLGTGVLGLVEMTRRKFMLWTRVRIEMQCGG